MTTPYQNSTKVVVLAKIEATEGVDPGLDPTLDAFLCSALDIKSNPTQLTRGNYRPSISQDAVGIGRITCQLTFTHELKGSGVFGVAPRIGRLLQGCGFQQTSIANTAAAAITAPAAGPLNTGPVVSWAKTAVPTSNFDTYRVLVTTGGVSGTARGLIMSDGFPEGDATVVDAFDFTQSVESALGTVAVDLTSPIAPVITIAGTWAVMDVIEMKVYGTLVRYQVPTGGTAVGAIATAFSTAITTAIAGGIITATPVAGVVTLGLAGTAAPIALTTATPITLGASGAQVTPTWSGSLVAGDYYDVLLLRPGIRYDPISDNIPSMYFYVYMDGTLHRIAASRGTFKVDGKSADYARVSFTFTGQYQEAKDAPLPTNLVFESSVPFKCELMQFTIKGMPAVAGQTWSMDCGNTLTEREDWNQSDGWLGTLITERKPKLTADPESMAPARYNAWKRMRNADFVRTSLLVGAKGNPGNKVRIQANSAQYDKNDYKDRNKIRVWDMSLVLSAATPAGNDEVFFIFS